MISDNPTGIIELGYPNIKCLIFQINSNGNHEILSTSITKSEGIHNGVIVNISKASNAIRFCISEAEKKAKISLKKVSVIVEQPDFLCTKFSKHRKIDGSKIHKDDIAFLLKEAKKQVIHNDNRQSIIHIFNHNYIVDGKTFVEEPINVYADYMSHEMTFITMPKNNIKNIKQAFVECDIEVERFISSIFATAAKLLNDNELQTGANLIDIGYEKTSLGLFKNLALIHSITLPVGINHIVKDISKVCSLSLKEAEIIINKIDFSFQKNEELFDEKDYLKDIYFDNTNFRKISKSLLLNVIKARLDEIFEIIKKQTAGTLLTITPGSNFFMIGVGSELFNLEKYCLNFSGLNVKKIYIANKKENGDESDENFVSCLGALRIIKDGWETEAIPEPLNKNNQKIGFFSKIFGIRP